MNKLPHTKALGFEPEYLMPYRGVKAVSYNATIEPITAVYEIAPRSGILSTVTSTPCFYTILG